MKRNRAEFSALTKRRLAERVAGRCSAPGCGRITTGPAPSSTAESVNLGKAAHIYAAAPKGPRANPAMTQHQLSAIENAIWLCSHHAEIIDKDPEVYSPETLLHWKQVAEAETHRILLENRNVTANDLSTLVGVGSDVMFYGTWISVSDDSAFWEIEIDRFFRGSWQELQQLHMGFDQEPLWERYVAIESQGQGRELRRFGWRRNSDNKYVLNCLLGKRHQRLNPHLTGGDISMDLSFENGDFKIVRGVDSAIQSLRSLLGTPPGHYADYSPIGSHFVKYCKEMQRDTTTLSRLLKMEIIRLMEVRYATDALESEFSFINRVIDAKVMEVDEKQNVAKIKLELEFGNFEHWKNELLIPLTPSFPSHWFNEDIDW